VSEPCLSENTLVELLDGTIVSAELAGARRHLQDCAGCREVLTEMTLLYESGHPLVEAVAGVLKRGATVGRYQIGWLVGAGAMGTVYAAHDPDLDRCIALKLVRRLGPATTAEQARARLLREAKAMALLHHPNVVAVHDVGTFGDQVFLAMELVKGQTLSQWLAETQRPWRQILAVFLQAGRGLAAAHAAGLVHRDFKPDNVLVDGAGQARVTDFGLARLQEVPGAPEPGAIQAAPPVVDVAHAPTLEMLARVQSRLTELLTHTGALVGTPAYMAPEQLAGRAADPRSDQFSFCVALYEALCGTRPFLARDSEGLRAAIAAQRLTRPTATTAPPWLLGVLARGLREDPGARWPSMDALLQALADDPQRRRRRWLLAAAAGVTLLAAGLGVRQLILRPRMLCRGAERELAGVFGPEQRRALAAVFAGSERSRPYWAATERALDARLGAWVAAREQACEATRVRGVQSEALLDLRMRCLDDRLRESHKLVEVLQSTEPEHLLDGPQAVSHLPSLAQCSELAALQAEVKPPSDPAARVRLDGVRAKLAEARALRWVDPKRGLPIARETVAAAQKEAYAPLLAEALFVRASHEEDIRDVNAAFASYKEALVAAERGHHDRALAESALGLALLEAQIFRRSREAQLWTEMAGAAIDRLGGSDELEIMRLDRLATALRYQKRAREAVEPAQRALALAERTWGPDDLRLASRLTNAAIVDMEVDLPRAEREFARALAATEKVCGPNHPEVGTMLMDMAVLATKRGHWEEAERLTRRALTLIETAYGENAQVAYLLRNLGGDIYFQGRKAEALPYLQRAIAIQDRVLGPDNVAVGEWLSNEAQVLYDLQRWAELAPLLERLLAKPIVATLSPYQLAAAHFWLAETLLHGGRERARAVALVRAADASMHDDDDEDAPKLRAQLAAWLAKHG
jgi:tetratricopeptide (TPR) repeat protein